MKSIAEMEAVDVPTSSFNCLAQQLIALCTYKAQEYEALFLGEQIKVTDSSLKEQNRYFEHAEKFYGIKLLKTDFIFDENYNSKYPYGLAFFDVTRYPLCANIENPDVETHAAIIYEMRDEYVYLYDNYYLENEVKLSKKEFLNSMISFWKFEYVHMNPEIDFINSQIKQDLLDTAELLSNSLIVDYFQNLKNDHFNTELIEADIHILFSFLIKKCCLWEKIDDDYCFNVCISCIRKIGEKLRNTVYQIYKKKMRKGELDENEIRIIKEKIIDSIEGLPAIIEEMIFLVNGETSIKDKITEDFRMYLGVEELPYEESVYVRHDGVTILRLVNYLEDTYDIDELSPLIFTGLETYGDFINAFYGYYINLFVV